MNALAEFLKSRKLTVPDLAKILKGAEDQFLSERSIRALKEGHMKLQIHHVDELNNAFKLSLTERKSLLLMVEEDVTKTDLLTIYSLQEIEKLTTMAKNMFPSGLSLKSMSELLQVIRKSS